jgi:hypothetical protein
VAIPKSVLAAAVMATFLVPGCAAPNQATYSCTPEVGGEPYACVKEQHDLMVERNQLYAEAEAVYRKFFAEDDRILRAGGTDELTPLIAETTTGTFQVASIDFYRGVKASDTRIVGGETRMAYLRPAPKAQRPGTLVAMETCTDASSATRIMKGDPDQSAGYLAGPIQFARVGEQLKISGSGMDVVESC